MITKGLTSITVVKIEIVNGRLKQSIDAAAAHVRIFRRQNEYIKNNKITMIG